VIGLDKNIELLLIVKTIKGTYFCAIRVDAIVPHLWGNCR